MTKIEGEVVPLDALLHPSEFPKFDFSPSTGCKCFRCEINENVPDAPASLPLLEWFTPIVSGAVGHPVKPTRSFACRYHPNVRLPAHADRAECQWTLAIPLEYSAGVVWPFVIDTGTDVLEVDLDPGDGLVYSGFYTHWREPQEVSQRVTMLLLHYVDEPCSA
jgi:hypothetical protein